MRLTPRKSRRVPSGACAASRASDSASTSTRAGSSRSKCIGSSILPAATNLLPVLTPIAAAALAAESVLIGALYIHYSDRPPLTYSVAMAIMAAFTSCGRFALKPF
jgi:hypothetical protein